MTAVNKGSIGWQFPPLDRSFPADRIDVWQVRLDASEPANPRWTGVLAPDEIVRASRLRFEDDRWKFLKCRYALRILLGDYLDVSPAAICFRYENNGKPEIAGPLASRGLRFNVSNSGALALIALASGRAVGIDVEKIRPLDDGEEIAKRFFSPREVAALLALDKTRQRDAFFACWTKKEAFLKATGEGLSYPLSAFSVTVDPDEPAALLEVRSADNPPTRWSLVDLRPGDGYMAALAFEGPVRRIERWVLNPRLEFAKRMNQSPADRSTSGMWIKATGQLRRLRLMLDFGRFHRQQER